MADLIIKPWDIGQMWTWFFRTFQFFFRQNAEGPTQTKTLLQMSGLSGTAGNPP
jgi:hypothetical protein